MTYESFFRQATGGDVPFAFQSELATCDRWPDVLHVPTGSGKTAAAVLGWLWRRKTQPDVTPRRLVYCLPMRVLVEQTVQSVETWLANAGPIFGGYVPQVYGLLGGAVEQGWESHPERPAILIGTQDQLLSRALNRGYAMSRFKWPVHFGLLHNDAQWVFDEVQLMGPGLETSAQLEGIRRQMGSALPSQSLWMSATLDARWLQTVDLPAGLSALVLAEDDRQGPLAQRLEASKPVQKADLARKYKSADLAKWLAKVHRAGTLTLVVVNQVVRAQELYSALAKAAPGIDRLLLHSRFRGADRRALEERIRPSSSGVTMRDGIVVSTQAIEAGVDISASTLVTELAPWTSLVQRFGRCNRRGDDKDARIFWLDFDEAGKGMAAPYEVADLVHARALLGALEDARPERLPEASTSRPIHHVLRRRDLLDLFDTDPDLDGNHIDVSRFIREPGGADVAVFWRNVGKEGPGDDLRGPSPEEVCLVSLSRFREFVRRGKRHIWQWDALDGAWVRIHVNERGAAPGFLVPGFTYLVECSEGGYSAELGFDPAIDGTVREYSIVGEVEEAEALADDPVAQRNWLDLRTHSLEVREAALSLCTALDLTPSQAGPVEEAAHWHDAGKAHELFQEAAGGGEALGGALLAKAPRFKRYKRRGFRHELVSALQAISCGKSDLVAYLVAAHHGKVRLQIRSLINETGGDDRVVARGVAHGDVIAAVDLGQGVRVPEVTVDLSVMRMGRGPGGPSWTDRTARLLNEHGPFRLAFLESLVRIADWRASGATARIEDDAETGVLQEVGTDG